MRFGGYALVLICSASLGCGAKADPAADAGDPTIVVLAAGQAGPLAIAVDGSSVYWVNYAGGTVMRTGLDGGTPEALAADQDHPMDLVVDATDVIWVTVDSVVKWPLGGGAPVPLASDSSQPWAVAVDGSFVYWIGGGRPPKSILGRVMRVSREGGEPLEMSVTKVGPGIAVDESSVYWGEFRVDGSVLSRSLGPTGDLSSIAALQNHPGDLTLDSGNIYWVDSALAPDGAVMKRAKSGGAPVALARGQDEPVAIAIDGTSAYWVNRSGGTVMKVGLDGGTPTILASGQDHPSHVAVDATSVYWTTADGRVMQKRGK